MTVGSPRGESPVPTKLTALLEGLHAMQHLKDVDGRIKDLPEILDENQEFASAVSNMASDLCWACGSMKYKLKDIDKLRTLEPETVEHQAAVDALFIVLLDMMNAWSGMVGSFEFYAKPPRSVANERVARQKEKKHFFELADAFKSLSGKFEKYMRLLDGVEK